MAVHLKGAAGSFRPLDDKPGLTLSFDRFRRGQLLHGLSKVHLNNSVEDPSYLTEELGGELFRAAGIPAPRVAHARVEINGRRLGLYVLIEGFTPEFLGGYFQRADGNLYEPVSGHDIDRRMKRHFGAGTNDQSDLKALAAASLEPDPSRRWGRLSRVLDVDRFVTFMALEVMIGHRDGYCLAINNFRIYHDSDSDRMLFLPHGMDQLFGTANLPWRPHLAGLVARAVIETPQGKELYRQRFAYLLQERFDASTIAKRADEILADLRPQLHGLEFGEVSHEVEALKQRIRARAEDLRAQLGRPELGPLKFENEAALLSGWSIMEPSGNARMDQTRTRDGKLALHIVSGRATSASWKTRMMLGRGHYRLEGKAMVEGVKPLPFGASQGAGLRLSGHQRREGRLIGTTSWKAVYDEFEISQDNQTVEVVCELRASGGEAWFDLESLRIMKKN